MPYESYGEVRFGVPKGLSGDCFDRYLIRLREMRASLLLIKICINNMTAGQVSVLSKLAVKRRDLKTSMEALIQHFKYMSAGRSVTAGECYVGT